MTGRRYWWLAAGAAGLLLAIDVARVALWSPLAVAGQAPADGYVRIPGVLHVHTTHSDGGGSPAEVAAAARRAGLGFVVITDHNNLDAKPSEGFRDGVLVMVGTEISTDAGHLLAVGIPDPQYRFSPSVADGLDDVLEEGGAAFAAHPVSPRADLEWSGWLQSGPWGLEVVNGDSALRAAGFLRLLRTAALYPIDSRYALLASYRAPAAALRRWDEMLRERAVPAVAGADAHSRVRVWRDSALRFPSYETLFGLVRTYVLLDAPLPSDAVRAAALVTDALARGRSYIGVDALAPADGFFFVAEAGGRVSTMGETIEAGPGITLRAGGRLPEDASIRLLRDGQQVAEASAALAHEDAAPGVYRVEVRLRGWSIPWVLSNPIYVFGRDATAARQAKAQRPPRVLPTPVDVLEAFENGAPGWETAADPSSHADARLLDGSGEERGSTAARLAFRLSPQPDAHTYAGVTNWAPRDLSAHKGLMFRVRADGEYRLWVQVRDVNPASTEDGVESWFASVKATPTWRTVAVPFATLQSLNAHSDGRLDLDQVRGLLFVVDRGSVKPGTKGTIWIDDVAVF